MSVANYVFDYVLRGLEQDVEAQMEAHGFTEVTARKILMAQPLLDLMEAEGFSKFREIEFALYQNPPAGMPYLVQYAIQTGDVVLFRDYVIPPTQVESFRG